MAITKPCECCGKLVTRSNSHMRGKIYCSRECSQRKRKDNIPTTKVCIQCGKEFLKRPKDTWKHWNNKRFCTHECYSESLQGVPNPKVSEAFKKLWKEDEEFKSKMKNRHTHSLKTREKIGAAFRGKTLTREHKMKISEGLRKSNHPIHDGGHNDRTKRKISESKKGIKLSEEHKKILSEHFTGRKLSMETRKKLSDISKKKWQDPIFVANVLEGLSGKKPTSLEIKLANILNEMEIAYKTQVPISRSIVDFLVIDTMKVIEADGKHWHSSNEQKKKDHRRDRVLNSLGYEILRLSEDEIYGDPREKIKLFLNL